jgi:hypothetical protein
MSYWRIPSIGSLFALACLLGVGCGKPENAPPSPEEAVENFVQKLVLDVEGKSVEIPLEKMDVFLVKRGSGPEIFEIHGTGVVLVGTFPKDVRVDYGEHWEELVGKAITISPRGGDPREPSESQLTLPGKAPLKVLGGTFTVEKRREGFDAKTPLSGRIEIKCQTPQGEKTYKGTFAVKGTTWG